MTDPVPSVPTVQSVTRQMRHDLRNLGLIVSALRHNASAEQHDVITLCDGAVARIESMIAWCAEQETLARRPGEL